MTPANENNLVYIPCIFDGFINNITKTGSISNTVDKNTGAPTSPNGIVAENNNLTLVDVSKMVASAMIWCRNLFVVPEEGEFVSANFMEPVFEEMPDNASLIFEYECTFDYSKARYFGKNLTDNKRVSLYNLTDKVENLTLMSGASVSLENRFISDKLQIEVLNNVSDDILDKITKQINVKLSKYKNFSDYCREQMSYSKFDPVIVENTIRNGRTKGVYNTIDSYDASGGLLQKLTQLSNLSGIVTYPKTDQMLRYYLCNRNNGKIGVEGNQLYLTLGYDSKLTLDCTKSYFDLSTQ